MSYLASCLATTQSTENDYVDGGGMLVKIRATIRLPRVVVL